MSIRVYLHIFDEPDARCLFINPDITYHDLCGRITQFVGNVEFCLKFWSYTGEDDECPVILGTPDELTVFLSSAAVLDNVLRLTVFRKHAINQNQNATPGNGTASASGQTHNAQASWYSTAGAPVRTPSVQLAQRARARYANQGPMSPHGSSMSPGSLNSSLQTRYPGPYTTSGINLANRNAASFYQEFASLYQRPQTTMPANPIGVPQPDSTVPGSNSPIVRAQYQPAPQLQQQFGQYQYAGPGQTLIKLQGQPPLAPNLTPGTPGSLVAAMSATRPLGIFTFNQAPGSVATPTRLPAPNLEHTGPAPPVPPSVAHDALRRAGSQTGDGVTPTVSVDRTDLKDIKVEDLKPLLLKVEPPTDTMDDFNPALSAKQFNISVIEDRSQRLQD